MPIIGLTGSLGTGKSTVAAMMAKQGAMIIDADAVIRQLLVKNKKCIKKVAKAFPSVILSNSEVDRSKLADIVFQNPRELKKLTQILYPEAIKEIKRQISTHQLRDRLIVIDVPLLFESGWDKLVDTSIVVKSRKDQQYKRAAKRLGLSRTQVQQRLSMQLPLRQKCHMADMIIDNSRSLSQTRKAVSVVIHTLEQRAKANRRNAS